MQQLDELLILSLRSGMFIFCVAGEGFEVIWWQERQNVAGMASSTSEIHTPLSIV